MDERDEINVPDWYVLTGGPSSGKTTILKKLAKLGFLVYPEAARVLIDREIAQGKSLTGIRSAEERFQREVLRMKKEIEEAAPKDKIVFFDRAIPDSIAYYQISGMDIKEVLEFCGKWIYKKIFFFEQLPFIQDYARTEDKETIEKLNKLLQTSYEGLGYKVISIPKMSVEKRLQKILEEIWKGR